MIRRSAVVLSKAGRTVVRDPRKQRLPSVRERDVPTEQSSQPVQFLQTKQNLPFEPTQQNQQSVGSSLASYMLAGAGMAIGFTIVGAIFGGI